MPFRQKLIAAIAAFAVSSSFAATNRPSWVSSEIYSFNHPYASQGAAELATKMQKMSQSPFLFYRGTAHIFYKDMTTLPGSAFVNAATSKTWLEGDLHLANFGALRDSAGNDVFDINDFDEGYFGPYVWDIRRLAVSIVLAARENGLSDSDARQSINDAIDAYLNKMGDFKGTSDEANYRLTKSNTSGVVGDTIDAASGQSRSSFLAKYTTTTSNNQFVNTNAELVAVSSSVYSAISASMSSYISSIPSSKRYSNSYYALKDIRQKLGSGTGSLGRYRYWLLVEGPSSSSSDDVIIEMKQEAASAVSLAAPDNFPAASYGSHQGERVALTLRAQVSNADRLAGYTTANGLPYFLREKSPYQADFDYTQLTSSGKLSTAVGYMGKVLAKVHASADKDFDATLNPYSEDKEITDVTSGQSGTFKTEIGNFAIDYANQVQLDWQAFKNAYTNGVTLY